MLTFPKPYADTVARLRVPSGFVLGTAFLILAQPTVRSILLSVPVSLLGLLLRAWAAGHLEKNRELTASGPYAYVRNPLYLGTLIAAAGLVAASRRWELAVLFSAVFVFVYLPVIQLEEQHLRKLFPAFRDYAAAVPLLLPRGWRPQATRAFRWGLYMRNEEYQAAFGYLTALAVLFIKASL